MKDSALAIIPARMASTRFPGKPMALIHGMPMIGHVYFRTRRAKSVQETYVATCDREIYDYIRSVGGKAVMTSDSHQRCSDRTAEAMLSIEKETGMRADVVAMVQGDEPMVSPRSIDEAVRVLLDDRSLNILCLMSPIDGEADGEDPNLVKVVVDLKGFALYFSREPIPSRRKSGGTVRMFKQYPIIPFRRDYLLHFNALPPTPLEAIESVDLLRILEHGERVKMLEVPHPGLSVDTPGDLARVVEAMRGDSLKEEYASKGLVR